MTIIGSSNVLAIVRFRSVSDLVATFEGLREGGISLVEVTIDTPGALEAVERMASEGRTVGVGTVLTTEHVKRSADAGARFVVSPGLVDEVVAEARARGIEPIPGVFTPSEILRALAMGVEAVKLFPASVGGPDHVRSLRGPFPATPFLPTGGIGISAVRRYLDAGATCVGLGSELVGRTPPSNEEELERLVARAAAALREASVA
jgi:2-dehydro-3-deoxyphosphogluconate aldolase/(4S)-4-hydroxy-2-oxoglutarate aldolase